MTDKPIIIDGVDVSGCELYRDDNEVIAPDGTAERTELCFLTNDYCGNDTNCYYKQLKRKEQECEMLKHDNGYEVGALERTIDNLKAEVKSKTEYIQEQRDIINQYSKEIEMYKKCQGKRASKREEELKAENDELKFQNKRLDEVATHWHKSIFKVERSERKLKQTLTEIKKICKKESGWVNCSDNMPTETAIFAEQILQKISECEVE